MTTGHYADLFYSYLIQFDLAFVLKDVSENFRVKIVWAKW